MGLMPVAVQDHRVDVVQAQQDKVDAVDVVPPQDDKVNAVDLMHPQDDKVDAVHVVHPHDDDQVGAADVMYPQRHKVHAMDVVYPELKEEESRTLHEYELNSLSENSRQAYSSDLRAFVAFLERREPSIAQTPERASYVHCLLFLTDMAERQHLSLNTIMRRWSFLKFHLIPSLGERAIQMEYEHVIKGLKKKLDDGQQKGKRPLKEEMVYAIANSLRGWSDFRTRQSRLLMLFMYHSAMRRSEIRAIRAKDVTSEPRGVVLSIPKSKTGLRQQIAITRRAANDPSLCVVKELEAWLACIGAHGEDFVFRKITKSGVLTDEPVAIAEMVRVIKDGAVSLSLPPAEYACHSTRSGFCTSKAAASVPLHVIAKQTRHRNLSSLQAYLKDDEAFSIGI
jgi:integrase